MNFHSKPTLEKDKPMTDPKLMDIMTETVMSTPSMMDNGKDLPRLILLHSPHHKTHYIATSFHSRLSQEKDKLMTDPKHTDITMEMVTSTLNTMDSGKDLPK